MKHSIRVTVAIIFIGASVIPSYAQKKGQNIVKAIENAVTERASARAIAKNMARVPERVSVPVIKRVPAHASAGQVKVTRVAVAAARNVEGLSSAEVFKKAAGHALTAIAAGQREVTNAWRGIRLLSTVESRKLLFPHGDLFYVPLALNTPQTAVYRGFSLPDLESLENIAKNGLELNKIQIKNATEYAIFASHRLELAFHYSLSRSNEEAIIPVVVKIPVTKQCKPLGYNGHFVFTRDVAAQHISEIMAFLEIDGKATWCKVTRQEDKMVLTPVPSQQFTANELMVHYFQAQPINLDMD